MFSIIKTITCRWTRTLFVFQSNRFNKNINSKFDSTLTSINNEQCSRITLVVAVVKDSHTMKPNEIC